MNKHIQTYKNPYKNNMSAYFNQHGKKGIGAGYYFHLEPNKCFIACGIWMPSGEVLSNIRQEIDYNYAEFIKIVQNKKFVAQYGGLDFSEGMSLVREPKGYEKENPAIAYLKLKSWVATAPLSDTALQDKNLATQLTKAFEYLQPLISFLNEALEA
jgi:uncharacterized protein (TIGR02453 family)